MDFDKDIEEFLEDLQQNLLKAMPKIRKEIGVYEDKLASGDLTQEPIPGSKFPKPRNPGLLRL